jgi:hypothetical protein
MSPQRPHVARAWYASRAVQWALALAVVALAIVVILVL